MSNKEEYHDMIKQLRDERYDVDKVYLGNEVDPKDTVYDADEEPKQVLPRDDIVQEIHEIADSAYIAHLMDTAEEEVPVYCMKKDLTPSKEEDMEILLIETEETADVVDHIDMGELIGLMSRNWKALKELTVKQIRDAMVNIYNDKDPIAMEAAIDTALYVVRAEVKAA